MYFMVCLQHTLPNNMPSSRIREIPIFREADQHQSRPAVSGRTASPANCPSSREIPIQRDTGIGDRTFGDFFRRQDRDWPDHCSAFSSDIFDKEPFSHSSGFRSRAGFPSHVTNDFWGDRRSPVQMQFSRQPGDTSSPRRTESPVTTSYPPENTVAAETTSLSVPEQPDHSVPVIAEPAATHSEPAPSTVPSANHQTETTTDATDGSLRVEEPRQRPRSPSPAPPNMTPLEIIEQVLAEGARLKAEVEVYTGGRKEKPYLRLEELLTRLMLKLDRIESEGRDDIRSARREAVHTIQSTLELLESRSQPKECLPVAKPSEAEEKSGDIETSCTNDRDIGETKTNTDAAAVKEMVLGSEVPC